MRLLVSLLRRGVGLTPKISPFRGVWGHKSSKDPLFDVQPYLCYPKESTLRLKQSLPPSYFRRYDESDDSAFYIYPRLTAHIDTLACDAVTGLFRELLPTDGHLLDLMSSFVSHLPPELNPRQVVGLPELKIIDVFICKLRKKLAAATGGEHYIETVWGRGYVLRDPQELGITATPSALVRWSGLYRFCSVSHPPC